MIQRENMFQLKFISMNNNYTKLFYCRALGASIHVVASLFFENNIARRDSNTVRVDFRLIFSQHSLSTKITTYWKKPLYGNIITHCRT